MIYLMKKYFFYGTQLTSFLFFLGGGGERGEYFTSVNDCAICAIHCNQAASQVNMTVLATYEGHPLSFWMWTSRRMYGFLAQSSFS